MTNISAEQLRGAAAIVEMVAMIGESDDHDAARVLCDNEMAIRAFMRAALLALLGAEDAA